MKHTGTEYNVIQRFEAATAEWHKARDNLIDAHDSSWLRMPRTKRKLTMAKTRMRKAQERLTIASVHWLQHHPLKG